MKKIYVCSPFRPISRDTDIAKMERDRNLQLAEQTCRWLSQNGFMPLAPHLYFTRFLDDDDPTERSMGFSLALNWLEQADELLCVGERISEGMQAEIEHAKHLEIPVYFISEPRFACSDYNSPFDVCMNL